MAQNRISGDQKRSAEERSEPDGAVTTAARKVMETAQDAVEYGKAQATQKSATLFNRQKSVLTNEVSRLTGVVREATKGLEDDDQLAVANYLNSAVGMLDRFETYVDDATVESLLADAESCARKRPAIFYGGLFVAGVAAARFLKAASEANARIARENEQAERAQASTSADKRPRKKQTN